MVLHRISCDTFNFPFSSKIIHFRIAYLDWGLAPASITFLLVEEEQTRAGKSNQIQILISEINELMIHI